MLRHSALKGGSKRHKAVSSWRSEIDLWGKWRHVRAMKHTRLAPALLSTMALCLSACSYSGDPVEREGIDASDVAELKQAAAEAQTPRTSQSSYLIREPGEGFLTPELLHSGAALNGPTVRSPRISPDGTRITLLKGREDDASLLDLWSFDSETGEGRVLVSSTDLLGAPEELSEEEKNRRERLRLYASGIVSYSWVGDQLLMFPLGGDIYLYDLATETARQITATKGFETDPKVSKDGSLVAYVRGDELFVKELETGLERQLTDDATDVIRNATASFVVQEELDRTTGYWISPDANRIAYTQIDESPIAIETRANIGPDGITTLDQRYPFAGTDNATVRLGIVPLRGGATRWLDLGDDPDIYLSRVAWAPDGQHVYAGILSRDQKSHQIYRYDVNSGARDLFYQETSETWINILSGFKATEAGLRLISERDGKRRYYEITEDGIEALTPRSLSVRSVRCETGDTLYISGQRDDPLSRHLFRVERVAASQPVVETDRPAPVAFDVDVITSGDGQHSASFDGGCTRYLGRFSSNAQPAQTRVFDADGTALAWLSENALDADHPFAPFLAKRITPEYGTLQTETGQALTYELYKPLDLKPGERRASVTLVYGGPASPRVINRWERKHLANILAHHGFVVFQIDGRGSSINGQKTEDFLYRQLGRAELVDQKIGAVWLKEQPFIDPDRMGVYGWSYGGYMTLMMLGQTDDYASGVAGAPVTEWELYDTAYTERYLGDPRPDHPNHTPGAYERGSVFPHLDGLSEPVLVIHGMSDDNVVFRHTVKLIDAMQKRGQHNLRLMTYPGEKHGFRGNHSRMHRDRQILDFFLDTLDEEDAG